MNLPAAWRFRWWSWMIPLVIFVAGLGTLWFNVVSSANGFKLLQSQVRSQEKTLETLTQRRIRVSELVHTARRSRDGLGELYGRRLASQSERLTQVIQEVKALAARAGIQPPRISYREQKIADFGLIEESLVFRVTGNYGQIRQLINLLEVSEDFLILEEIDLRETDGSQLDIDLSLSTLFAASTGRGSAEGRS